MGFQFNRRISIGKGFGVNISKSGVTPSVRTKFGSLSTKGFSLRTGIKGLSYRSSGCLCILSCLVLTVYLMTQARIG